MSKKKRKKEISTNGLNINEQLHAIRNILDSCEQIFIEFRPLMRRILLLKEAEIYHKNGTIGKIMILLGTISKECEKLNFPLYDFEIPMDLMN